jgi:hypothetical protein
VASFFVDVSLAVHPQAVARLWLRLQELHSALRSEYVQVLVLAVVPLILLLAVLLVDLKTRRRVVAQGGYLTFRPSLAVRFAWFFTIVAVLVDLFAIRHHSWIIITADLLAGLELLRTFPRNLILGPVGLRWSNMSATVELPWEQVSCFVEQRSPFGVEYRLIGIDGQTLVINSLVLPGWKQIVRRIWLSLDQRNLKPSSALPPSPLDMLRRWLLPTYLLIIFLGGRI